MEMSLKLTGDFEGLGKTLTQSVKNVDTIGTKIVESNSEMYKKAVVDNIESQSIAWRPLNPDYKAGKGILGLDTRILVATGEYVNSIDIKELPPKGGKLHYHVGVDPNATHSSGINMGLLSLVMEYGTADGRIPARSHFGETWRQVRNKIRDNSLKYGREIWQIQRRK